MKKNFAVLPLIAVGVAFGGALPPMPLARAPFERSDAERMPVKMEVKAFSYGTNLWQGVEFVSGTKRLIVSGANGSIDCNNPLRFGRRFLLNGRPLGW